MRAKKALSALPEKQREAVVLFEIEGFSIEEVAKMQNAKISAVKSRLARGRARLRGHYEKMGWFKDQDENLAMSPEIPEGGKP
jgi:DNA-directed RNA polymerase specialized sigma24 family protein